MNQPKFLLDECVDIELAAYLEERGFSVTIPPKGLKNGAVAALAKQKSCILITVDNDFTNTDIFKPAESQGIIVLTVHPPHLNQLTQALDQIFDKIPSEEISGKLIIASKENIEVFE